MHLGTDCVCACALYKLLILAIYIAKSVASVHRFARQLLIRFWGAFLGGAIINRGCGILFYVHIAFVPEAWQKKLEPMDIGS